MYKYEFVRIELKSGFIKSKPKEDYLEIIISYAKKGWRFKQIFHQQLLVMDLQAILS